MSWSRSFGNVYDANAGRIPGQIARVPGYSQQRDWGADPLYVQPVFEGRMAEQQEILRQIGRY